MLGKSRVPLSSQLSHFICLSVGGYEMAKKEDVVATTPLRRRRRYFKLSKPPSLLTQTTSH